MCHTEAMFILDSRLEADTHFIIQWPLCQILLLDDSRFPWLVLVPARADLTESFDLATDEQELLWQEASAVGRFMKDFFKAHKINTAALGNVVSQLHVHVIARFRDDVCFPSPVWGVGKAERYSPDSKADLIDRLAAQLCQIEL